MTHPHRLHATAAVWSLRSAWPHLTHAAQQARHVLSTGDAGTLRAWAPSTGGGTTVHHSDGILGALLANPGQRAADRLDRIATSTRETIIWVAQKVLRDDYRPGDPVLTRLLEEIPRITPAAAAEVARWVDEADTAVRSALGMADDHEPLVGVACPACGSRRLAVRTSAPTHRPVVCAAGCTCAGAGCECGMAEPVEGVGHIWVRTKLGSVSAA